MASGDPPAALGTQLLRITERAELAKGAEPAQNGQLKLSQAETGGSLMASL